jgi:hypothetical protein
MVVPSQPLSSQDEAAPIPISRPVSLLTRGFGSDAQLPVSHPADADWRFTSDSTAYLLDLANIAADDQTPIVHLGTPSTFLCGTIADPLRQHVLLDRNTAVLDAINARGVHAPHVVIGVDLQAVERLRFNAGAVIADPPWYLDDTVVFLSVAVEVAAPGATIVLCQPAVGTRPGVRVERDALLDRVSSLGLELIGVRSSSVRYMTPHFEAVSLKVASNIAAVPQNWRRGDVLLLRSSGPAQQAVRATASSSWHEVKFGPVRIKLSVRATGPDLGDLVPGDVLPTVSRRDPICHKIGLWTSGNRVLTLANPLVIANLITMCNQDLGRRTFSAENVMSHARNLGVPSDVAQKLYELLILECEEHSDGGSAR